MRYFKMYLEKKKKCLNFDRHILVTGLEFQHCSLLCRPWYQV